MSGSSKPHVFFHHSKITILCIHWSQVQFDSAPPNRALMSSTQAGLFKSHAGGRLTPAAIRHRCRDEREGGWRRTWPPAEMARYCPWSLCVIRRASRKHMKLNPGLLTCPKWLGFYWTAVIVQKGVRPLRTLNYQKHWAGKCFQWFSPHSNDSPIFYIKYRKIIQFTQGGIWINQDKSLNL